MSVFSKMNPVRGLLASQDTEFEITLNCGIVATMSFRLDDVMKVGVKVDIPKSVEIKLLMGLYHGGDSRRGADVLSNLRRSEGVDPLNSHLASWWGGCFSKEMNPLDVDYDLRAPFQRFLWDNLQRVKGALEQDYLLHMPGSDDGPSDVFPYAPDDVPGVDYNQEVQVYRYEDIHPRRPYGWLGFSRWPVKMAAVVRRTPFRKYISRTLCDYFREKAGTGRA